MNVKLILKLLGRVELLIAGSMLLPLGVALLYGESPFPFLASIALLLCTCLPVSYTHLDVYKRQLFFRGLDFGLSEVCFSPAKFLT